MTDQAEIDSATRRLSQALDMLDAAVERRIEIDRSRTILAEQVHALDADRSKLAADLDVQLGKVRGLESANREIARRLDAAMENIRLVLEFAAVRSSVSQVNVTINGRQFRMACEDGQEGHLQQLARELDERIVALRGQFGEIGDARLTVMAALMVADELAEAGKKLKRLEADHAALQDARGTASERAQATQAAIAAAFNSAAERIEGMAKKLGQTGGSGPQRCAGLRFTQFRDGWQWPPIRTTLLGRGCEVRQSHIPRGLTISKGAVPGRDPGSGHMAPTYLCRFPGSRSDGHRGSALYSFRRGMDLGPG